MYVCLLGMIRAFALSRMFDTVSMERGGLHLCVNNRKVSGKVIQICNQLMSVPPATAEQVRFWLKYIIFVRAKSQTPTEITEGQWNMVVTGWLVGNVAP